VAGSSASHDDSGQPILCAVLLRDAEPPVCTTALQTSWSPALRLVTMWGTQVCGLYVNTLLRTQRTRR
jgi:hypothetical protein